jgi:hypothetical protein
VLCSEYQGKLAEAKEEIEAFMVDREKQIILHVLNAGFG